jgi:hypothetical protein
MTPLRTPSQSRRCDCRDNFIVAPVRHIGAPVRLCSRIFATMGFRQSRRCDCKASLALPHSRTGATHIVYQGGWVAGSMSFSTEPADIVRGPATASTSATFGSAIAADERPASGRGGR